MPDLVGRDFSAGAISTQWCGDLAEIPADEGNLYLTTVEDLASLRLPDFAMGEHHDDDLAKAALCMAAAVRGGIITRVIFHSDKGGERTADTFVNTCKSSGMVPSMGRVGSAYQKPSTTRGEAQVADSRRTGSRAGRPFLAKREPINIV